MSRNSQIMNRILGEIGKKRISGKKNGWKKQNRLSPNGEQLYSVYISDLCMHNSVDMDGGVNKV